MYDSLYCESVGPLKINDKDKSATMATMRQIRADIRLAQRRPEVDDEMNPFWQYLIMGNKL